MNCKSNSQKFLLETLKRNTVLVDSCQTCIISVLIRARYSLLAYYEFKYYWYISIFLRNTLIARSFAIKLQIKKVVFFYECLIAQPYFCNTIYIYHHNFKKGFYFTLFFCLEYFYIQSIFNYSYWIYLPQLYYYYVLPYKLANTAINTINFKIWKCGFY